MFIDQYENVSIWYTEFYLAFRDTKTGEMLHSLHVGTIRTENYKDLINKIIDSDNKIRYLYQMCDMLAEEYEKNGFHFLNNWKCAKQTCQLEMVKWQRFLDSGDIEALVEIRKVSRSKQQKKRVVC